MTGMVSGLGKKPIPPKCADCGNGTKVHPYRGEEGSKFGGYVWLCGDCKYRRENPDAAPYVKLPAERRGRWKQKETLFDSENAA
jgi:hypothetical protein